VLAKERHERLAREKSSRMSDLTGSIRTGLIARITENEGVSYNQTEELERGADRF